ncbi:MAG: tetratricopeptide repeat protein, partial [Anaerolineales bacterium]|nr:tetratricopeptide repeat protein [Anaerolineales bacterium]
QVLNDLVRHLDGYAAAIVISSREPVPAEWFAEVVTPFAISLNNLSREGIKRLMRQFVDEQMGELEDSLVDFVALRTDGNPFFVEQVMLFFRDQGLLGDSSLDTLSARFDIPTDIRSVLVARLDRLLQDVKQVVQTAAVLGREFEVQLLAEMINSDSRFTVKLETATEAAIWLPLNQIRYIFKHGLMRDAAYNMQLQARLQELHRLAAVSFEALYGHDLAPYYGDLAYHYGRSGTAQREKTLLYLDLAARKMQAEYANEDALRYYEQALALEVRWPWIVGQIDVLHVLGRREAELAALAQLQSVAEAPAFTVQFLWGRYYEAIGNYEAAETAVQQALNTETNRLDRARGLNQLGIIARRQGSYDKARGFFEEAAALFTETPHEEAEVKAYAQIFSGLGTIYRQQGDFESAKRYYRQALAVSRDHQQLLEEAQVLNHLGVLDYYQRDFGEAERHHQQALKIRQTIGDRDGMGASLYNIAIIWQDVNDYDKAQKYYAEAQMIWQETQNRWEEVNAWNGLGMLAQQLGRLDVALDALMQGLTISREIGDEAGEAYVLANLGGVYHDLQNLPLAEETYVKGQQFAEAQNDIYMLSYFVSHRGMVSLDAAAYGQAIAQAGSALEMRVKNEMRLWTTADLTTLAAAHLALGETTQAQQYAEEAIVILDECAGKGPELPQRDYFMAYEVLLALGEEAAARKALAQAERLMLEKAGEIAAEEIRRSFLEQVGIHRQIAEAVGRW